MGLKLTLLLLAGIFLVMFFAPAAPPPAPRAPDQPAVTATPAPEPPAPEPPAPVPETSRAPVELPPVTALTRPATPTAPLPSPVDPPPTPQAQGAELAPTDPSLRAEDAPLTLPGLVIGTTGSDSGQALSLSDAVRERSEAARTATDTLLQELEAAPATEPLPQPTDPIPAPQETVALVTGDSVNLRAGPSTSNAVVGRVNFGQELVLTGPYVDGWASVINPATGQEAFMASRFLQVQP